MDTTLLLTLTLSLILGSFYTLVVGFGKSPFGLQESLMHLFMLASTWILLRKRGITFSRLHYSFLALAGAIAVYASITTNPLVRGVNTWSVIFVESMLLLALFRTKGFVTSATMYTVNVLKYIIFSFYQGIYNIVTFQILRLPWHKNLQRVHMPKPKNDVLKGVIFTIPILVIFHIFFAQINSEYSHFVNDMLRALWNIIKFIVNIDFIVLIGKLYISSSVFYALFTVTGDKQATVATKKQKALQTVTTVLCGTILLFGVFSFFQSKLLFINYTTLAFKALSLYTQHGFWELVVVSVLGYSLCLFIFGRIKDNTPQTRRLKQLLSVFVTELIVITVFSYHKLGTLQMVFGLKDQRILATAAVALITMTCVLFLLRLWGKIAPSRIFASQAVCLLVIALCFNIMNVDLFITNTYPIRYVVGGTSYKDYSYLLGNSYDNTSEWLGLMQESEKTGAPMPQEYYWGWYQPMCKKTTNYDHFTPLSNPTSSRLTYKTSSYLEEHYAYLQKKYDTLSWRTPLPQLTRVNLHEYQAYLLIKTHKATFDAFIAFAKGICMEDRQPTESKEK